MISRRKLGKAGLYALCLCVGLLIIAPLLYALSVSFMSVKEVAEFPPRFFPSKVTLQNYETVLTQIPFFSFMKNSFIVCFLAIAGQIVTCSFAAYAFAFFHFRGQKLLFSAVLATMMIPAEATIIANYLTIAGWRMQDTYFALVAPYLTSAMGIFLMRQFFMTIPKELHEAAELDGCGHLRFLFSIVLPMSKPIVASLAIYVFINIYNQFMWPLLVTNQPDKRTIQIGMSILRQSEAVNYGVVLAGAIIVVLPVIVVFIIGQKYLVKGMTAGAVKG